jgi:hypothetical protein
MDTVIALAWITAGIVAVFIVGVLMAVATLLAGYPLWVANAVRGSVVALCYATVAVRAIVVGLWPIGLVFATAAGIEAYWVWQEWKNNRPTKRESLGAKIVKLIAGRLKVVPQG